MNEIGSLIHARWIEPVLSDYIDRRKTMEHMSSYRDEALGNHGDMHILILDGEKRGACDELESYHPELRPSHILTACFGSGITGIWPYK